MIQNLSTNDILLAQHVKRWHMIRMRDEQSVAEHSFNVAMLTVKLLRALDKDGVYAISPEEQLAVMEWALCHDIHEIEHGDVPSPSAIDRGNADHIFWTVRKREKGPTLEARNFVSLMDKVEAYLYFLHHGCDAIRHGQGISTYLYNRVEDALNEFSRPVIDEVHYIINEGRRLFL